MRRANDHGAAWRWRHPLVLLGLLGLALAVYLPYALKAGWYYDDWLIFAVLRDAGGSWPLQFDACVNTIPGGRSLMCPYYVTEHQLFGGSRTAYHLVSIAFLTLIAGLVYTLLRRCRLAWPWAALVAAMVIVFPGNDSTRLWPAATVGQYVIALQLAAILITLVALGRARGRPAILLHVVTAVMSVLAMASYEIAVPLVALNGLVYWAARRDRRALWRGTVDLALAAGFVFYRLVISPVDPAAGFVVHRTPRATASRALDLLDGAWTTWHAAFLPGSLGLVGIVGVLGIAGVLAAREAPLRRRLAPWAALLGAGIVVACACALVFLPANDFYVLALASTFNRLNLPGTAAYAAVFVALLGLGYELLRRFVPVRAVAPAAVAVVALGSVWHQLGVAGDHKRSWEVSWSEQKQALDGYATALRDVPRTSRVIGLGAPIFESGFIPVFAATWDLRGALAYTTRLRPRQAAPLLPTMACGPRGMVLDGAPYGAYVVRGQPLYLASATRRYAVLVRSQAQCERVVAQWGRPPLWGRTVPR